MTDRDFKFREQKVREHLLEHGRETSISKLDFGTLEFDTLSDIAEAEARGEIRIAFDSAPEHAEVVLPKMEWRIGLFVGWLPAVFALAYVAAAFSFKDFWLLTGVVFLVMGYLGTSPYGKPFLGGVLWILILYFLFTGSVWAWILSGYYLGYIPAGYVRHLIQMNIAEACAKSEVFFAYFYQKRKILIRRKDSDETIMA